MFLFFFDTIELMALLRGNQQQAYGMGIRVPATWQPRDGLRQYSIHNLLARRNHVEDSARPATQNNSEGNVYSLQ